MVEVQDVIRGLLMTGTCSLTLVARHMNSSPRTLQRRLTTDGRSFRQLVADVKLLEGRRLLLETNLGIGEIAQRLHYSDSSHFGRMFRKQLGISPSDYRRLSAK